jgi:hypothetical protein
MDSRYPAVFMCDGKLFFSSDFSIDAGKTHPQLFSGRFPDAVPGELELRI